MYLKNMCLCSHVVVEFFPIPIRNNNCPARCEFVESLHQRNTQIPMTFNVVEQTYYSILGTWDDDNDNEYN